MVGLARTGPLLLGHRGCRLPGFRENSIPAFHHAVQSGCDGFEFDVRLTADQKAVCHHDSGLGKLIIEHSTYEQLLKHDLNSIATSETALPCLPDVLADFQDGAFLDIELKVSGLEAHTLRAIRQYPPQRGYVISSFLPGVVQALAELAPNELGEPAVLGLIFDNAKALDVWPALPVSWVVPRHNLVSQELIDAVHSAGRKLMTWTVNRPGDMLRFAEWGVDAMVSDDPALLCRTVRG